MPLEFPFHMGRLRSGQIPDNVPKPNHPVVMGASFEGAGIGVLYAHNSFFGRPFIDFLHVDEEFRRLGIAAQLVRHFISTQAEVWTSTNMSNAPARALFFRLGFSEAGLIEGLDVDDPEIMLSLKAK